MFFRKEHRLAFRVFTLKATTVSKPEQESHHRKSLMYARKSIFMRANAINERLFPGL